MKIVEGFVLREVLGDVFAVIGEGPQHAHINKIYSLNPTAAFLWKSVEGKEFTTQQLAQLLVQEYEIDEQQATADAEAIAQKWLAEGLIA